MATNSAGASVRLTISPFETPETTIAPIMSPASTNAVGLNKRPEISNAPPTISITPTAITNTPGTGRP